MYGVSFRLPETVAFAKPNAQGGAGEEIYQEFED
jgi:hypothetical protein